MVHTRFKFAIGTYRQVTICVLVYGRCVPIVIYYSCYPTRTSYSNPILEGLLIILSLSLISIDLLYEKPSECVLFKGSSIGKRVSCVGRVSQHE